MGVGEHGRSGQASLVRDLLREYLLQGGGARGRRLPHEHVLTRELGCSRNVLREALALLVADGLIRRDRGQGTHVLTTSPAISIDGGVDLRAAMLGDIAPRRTEAEVDVSYRVLRAGAVPAPALLAGLLGLSPGTGIWHVERLVETGGHRVGHWDAHIVATGSEPGSGKADVAALAGSRAAESLLRGLGLRPDHEELRVEAITPSPRTARLLYQDGRDQPTLRLSRRFFDERQALIALFIGRCALPGATFSVTRRCGGEADSRPPDRDTPGRVAEQGLPSNPFAPPSFPGREPIR